MSNSLIRILYIDDEMHNLASFKATFRKQYTIFTTTSVDEALLILEQQEIHVILADQRMPVMTGVQFFEKIRTEFPDPIRILITGYTDISAAIDSINKGEVFRFIDKPWDGPYVEIAITQAFEIYKNRKDLQQRNLDLEKAYEELDKFVYSASHDLRAPLMSVLGIINLAKIDTDPDSGKEYLGMMEQAVKKLDTFILNIIDYYKNSRGLPVIQTVNFQDLVKEVIDAVAFLPEATGVKRLLNIQQKGNFRSDIMKLRIILNNLIINAIKFRDDRKPEQFLKIDIEATEQSTTIVVEDNGVGIREDEKDKIFRMFHKGREKNSGSGIGLYIVHEAVEKLGGSIEVKSTKEIGTRFEIVLPSIEY